MALKKTTTWALLLVLSIAAALSYPAYRQIRMWRASSMAAQAETMLDTPEFMSRAWELAHAANALAPNDPEIARILARVYTLGDPASAYPLWEKVVELSDEAPEDRLELAKAYLRANLWSEFEAEIAAQRKDQLHLGQLDFLQTQAAVVQGNYEAALQMATALVAKGNAPHEADALFFQLSRISADTAVRRAGIDHLRKIATDDGLRQEEALKTLARLPDLNVADVNQLIRIIDGSDNPSRDMRLLAEELRLRLPETKKNTIYERASSFFELNDPAELVLFGRWLNRHGLHEFNRLAITNESAMARQDLFLILLDAMALDGQWEVIRKFLDAPRVPVEDYLREFFRMRTFYEMGDMRRARLSWDQALVAAARESPKLYYLANKARQLELPEFEIAALRRVVESPEMRESAFKALLAVLQKEGRSSDLLATMLQYEQYFPNNSDIGNDALYLGFLIDKPPTEAIEEAQALLESKPNMLAYRMTLVLGLLTQNRSKDALDLLVELSVNWFEVRDRWRLLAALALDREGFHLDAQTLIAEINPSNLLPEEQLFFEEISAAK
jgi:hypothetical protein